jgi:hypothetical protein
MSKATIEFVEEIDNTPTGGPNGYSGDYMQGTEWFNWRVYKVTAAEGDITYVKFGIRYNSYGDRDGFGEPQVCSPVTKTVTVWQ